MPPTPSTDSKLLKLYRRVETSQQPDDDEDVDWGTSPSAVAVLENTSEAVCVCVLWHRCKDIKIILLRY